MNIIVVIPAYNEARVIGLVVSKVKELGYKVVVVDDGSSDNTTGIARQSGANVVRHFINRGQGAALQTGILFAQKLKADIIVTFDADDQHQVSEIKDVVAPLLLGEVDIVLGSRFLTNDNKISSLKRLVLKLATWTTRLYTGIKITDTHNGFRAMNALTAQKIKINQDGMAHASEIIEEIKRNNLKYKEVPVTVNYTAYSIGKGQKLSNSFGIIWDLMISRLIK